MLRSFTRLFLLFATLSASAQTINPALYDTDRLSADFHAGRRAALRAKMPANSVAVIWANPERNRNNDTDFQYAQNPNFYYLTGYDEPNALLVLTKDSVTVGGQRGTEFFFAQNRDPAAEVWTGRRLGKEGAEQQLKLRNVAVGQDFQKFALDFATFNNVFSLLPLGAVDDPRTTADLYSLIEQFKAKVGTKSVESRPLYMALAELRQVKSPEEMVLLQRAIDITCQGHREVMKFMAPGVTEYQAQSVMEYMFKSHGSEYVGYGSIAGGAENACILHYVTNRRTLQNGDIFLTDCGAEYHGYTADITRTMPVNGKFSAEQRAIYNVVLAGQDAGFAACQPGVSYRSVHQAAFRAVAAGLFRLGIAKDSAQVRRYFNHGTAHSLGLDVHDAVAYTQPAPNQSPTLLMPVGFVTTVEPGVYIPAGSPCDPKWWNIGVRIEDDVLITNTGHKVLSLSAPRTADEVEKLMAQPTTFKRPAKRP